MTLRAAAQLPSAARRIGGLLTDARPITSLEDADGNPIGDLWTRGLSLGGFGCVEPALRAPCENQFTSGGDQVDAAQPPTGPWSFMPTTVRQGTRCSTLTRLDGARVSQARLDATREWAAGHVLQTGDHTDHDDGAGGTQPNPALVDGTVLVSAVAPVAGLATLEQAAADNLYGAPVVIHAPLLVATHLFAAGAIEYDGNRLRTVAGSRVIVSPGYAGDDLYATGEVFTGTGDRSVLDDTDRSVNTTDVWADELVLTVFDPCWVGVVDTDLT